MVLLRSLSSVPPTFLATYRYQASSICFVRIESLLVQLLLTQELLLLQSTGAQSKGAFAVLMRFGGNIVKKERRKVTRMRSRS